MIIHDDGFEIYNHVVMAPQRAKSFKCKVNLELEGDVETLAIIPHFMYAEAKEMIYHKNGDNLFNLKEEAEMEFFEFFNTMD